MNFKRFALISTSLLSIISTILSGTFTLVFASSSISINTLESDHDYMVLEVNTNPSGLFKNTQSENKLIIPPTFSELIGIPDVGQIENTILIIKYSFISKI